MVGGYRGVVGGRRGVVSGRVVSRGVVWLRSVVGSGVVVSLPLVGYLGGVAVVVVRMVGHVLGAPIREGHRVGALNVTWWGDISSVMVGTLPEPSEVSPAL